MVSRNCTHIHTPLVNALNEKIAEEPKGIAYMKVSNLFFECGQQPHNGCLPHGWHTLDIECEDVLSIGI